MNQPTGQANIDARHRTMIILWFALLMSSGIFFLLTIFIERPVAAPGNNILFQVFLGISIMAVLISFVLERKLLAQSVREQRPDLVQVALIMALALCEVASLLGLMTYFTSASPYHYVLFIIGVGGMLLHFPRRSNLLGASYKGTGIG